MNQFSDIIGQDQIRDHLQDAVKSGHISHAYILSGPKDSGKHFIANIFASAILCTDRQMDSRGMPEPCGSCISCIQAAAGSNPDILYVRRQPDRKGISVDVIRAMRDDVVTLPYAGSHKIYIIEDAETMNTQAQNALLKTIEEPPSYAVIILLADGTDHFLPTVMSRCVTLQMRQVPEELVVRFLTEKLGTEPARAAACANFASGILGRAAKLAADEQFDAERREAADFLAGIGQKSYADLADAVARYAPAKKKSAAAGDAAAQAAPEAPGIGSIADVCPLWFRDVLVMKAGMDVPILGEARSGITSVGNAEGAVGIHLIFSDRASELKRMADALSYEAIGRIWDAIAAYREQLARGTAADQAMLVLLTEIRDQVRGSMQQKQQNKSGRAR